MPTFTNHLLAGTFNGAVDLSSKLAGEDFVSNAQVAGLFVNGYRITASGVVTQLQPGSILESITILTAGSAGSFQAFDDSTNGAGNEITESIAFGSLTVGTVLKRWGGARRLNTGLYLTMTTGGVVIVNAKPAG